MPYCNEKAPEIYGPETICCNREEGHPGEHCRFGFFAFGYRNIWWPVQVQEDKTDDHQ